MTSSPIIEYIQSLDKELAAGNTTEHTHRPALKTLFQSLNPAITATNEPQHITAVGAPDFRIINKKMPIGYVECKDIRQPKTAKGRRLIALVTITRACSKRTQRKTNPGTNHGGEN